MTTSAAILPEHLRAEAAERSLLACVLRDAETAIPDALTRIAGAEDFYDSLHAEVFAACQRMFAAREPVEMVTIHQDFVRRGRLSEFGPDHRQWFCDIHDLMLCGADASHFAEIVHEAALRRRIRRFGLQIIAATESAPDGSAEELLERCRDEINRLGEQAAVSDNKIHPLADILAESLQSIDDRISNPEKRSGVPTGLADLDRMIGGGIRPGQIMIVAARPGGGKSAFVLGALVGAARAGFPGFMSSLEMTKAENANRLLSMGTGVNLSRIISASLDECDFDRLATAIGPSVYGGLSIFFDDVPRTTTARFESQLRRVIHRHGVQIAAIDYLQLVPPTDAREIREQQIAKVSRSLKLIARENGLPIIALAQVGRGAEDRVGGRPRLSDLRESGAIENDADVVLFLHVRPDQPADAECWTVDAIIEKNRNGPKGEFPLTYRRPVTRFENYVGHRH